AILVSQEGDRAGEILHAPVVERRRVAPHRRPRGPADAAEVEGQRREALLGREVLRVGRVEALRDGHRRRDQRAAQRLLRLEQLRSQRKAVVERRDLHQGLAASGTCGFVWSWISGALLAGLSALAFALSAASLFTQRSPNAPDWSQRSSGAQLA